MNKALDRAWLYEMGWCGDTKRARNFDDDVENALWNRLAPFYTEENNLNHDTPRIAEVILAYLSPTDDVFEIGPGTGNFTVLMAERVASVWGVDFSYAMRDELIKRCSSLGRSQVHVDLGKWEEYTPQRVYDFIVSVNSLYRIRNIRAALEKMIHFSKKGLIIVRTIQRSYFYKHYQKVGIPIKERGDVPLLIAFFEDMGITPKVTHVKYLRRRIFLSLEDIWQEIAQEVGQLDRNVQQKLQKSIENSVVYSQEGVVCRESRETMILFCQKCNERREE